jgi:hypothetical protein
LQQYAAMPRGQSHHAQRAGHGISAPLHLFLSLLADALPLGQTSQQ